MAENIKLKDLYNEEQSYTNIGTIAIPKADGSGDAYYVQRPVINYTLIDPPSHEIVVDGVDSVFVLNAGDGDDLGNIFGNAYGAVSGKTTKPIVAIAIDKYVSGIVTTNNGYARILYLYEVDGVDSVFVLNAGDGDDLGNIFGNAYGAVSGKTTKPIVAIAIDKYVSGIVTTNNGYARILYLYEELPGSVLKEIIGFTGVTDFTAGVGWGQLLSDDNKNVTGYLTITDVSSVVIGIEQPGGIVNADIFYSLLSEVTQEEQTVSVTENGEQAIVPAVGKSGIRKAVLNVNVAGGGGGVQPDWNQNDSTAADFVKNRPGAYYETTPELTFTYDGNPVGKTVFNLGDGIIIVKVSEAELPTQEQFAQPSNSLTVHTGASVDITNELGVLTYNPNYSGALVWMGEVFIAFVPSQEVATALNVEIGVYFGIPSATEPSVGYISSLTCKEIKNVVELPSEFLETDFSGRDVSAASVILNSSTSGSTKKFKITVDDTGTLKATEVTD